MLCTVRLSLIERSGNLIKLSTSRLGLRLLLELLGLVDLLLLLLMLLRFLQDGHCAIVLGSWATSAIAEPESLTLGDALARAHLPLWASVGVHRGSN